jgi:hypothetical protein
MILAFVGIAVALYGGAVLAGVVIAMQRPFLFLALTGEPLSEFIASAGAVVAAVMVGGGYVALTAGLDRVS